MSAVSRDTQDRNKTVCKGTGNGGIKGSANPSPANILIGTLMNASEPHGRTLRLNTPCNVGDPMSAQRL